MAVLQKIGNWSILRQSEFFSTDIYSFQMTIACLDTPFLELAFLGTMFAFCITAVITSTYLSLNVTVPSFLFSSQSLWVSWGKYYLNLKPDLIILNYFTCLSDKRKRKMGTPQFTFKCCFVEHLNVVCGALSPTLLIRWGMNIAHCLNIFQLMFWGYWI